jgi:hypothetical protein
MAVDEYSRRVLYQRLEDVLGLEAATALMDHLPPVGWADVATKHDLDAQSVLLKQDLEALSVLLKHDLDAQSVLMKHDLDAQVALLRQDLTAQSVQFKRDLEAQGGVLTARMDAMGEGLRAEFRGRAFSLFFSVLAANATVLGMAVALQTWF